MRFSAEQRCAIIQLYYSNNRSYRDVKEQFLAKWRVNVYDMQIKRIIDKFEKEHTVADRAKSGRPRARTPAFRETVAANLVAVPTVSSRRLAHSLQATHTTTYRTMRDLAFPYKLTVCQELKPVDAPQRVTFVNWLLNFCHNRHSVFDTMFFSDEAWFHLSVR